MSYVHADDRFAGSMTEVGTHRDQRGRVATAWARLVGWLAPAGSADRPQGIVRLPRHGWRSIARPDGLTVRCLLGEAVVTQEGDPRDLLLVAGETMRIQGRGHLVIQATQEAELRFTSTLLEGKVI